MNIAQKIAKNTIVLLISQVIMYGLAFLYTIYSARYLGVEGFGILSFALAFTGIFNVLADLGLSTLTTRDVSRDTTLTNKYVVNIIFIKIILGIITFLLTATTVNLLNYPKETTYIVYIISLSIIVGNFSIILYPIFQAYQKMEYQALSQILNSFVLFISALFAISQGFDIVKFATIYLTTNLIVLIYNFIVYFLKFGMIKINIDFKFWRYLIKEALPLSLSLIFSTITFRIDTVILSSIINNTAVGLYTASYKLMEATLFIPMVLSIAVLPVFSNFYLSSKKSLEISYEKSIKYLIILGLPASVGTTLLAREIIILIYGQGFTDSIISLQILIWTIPFIFLTYIFKVFFVSTNKQTVLLKIIIINMIFNIILNITLIPNFSYIGASLVTVLTELLSAILCFHFLSRFIVKINLIKLIFKPIFACIIMALFLIFVKTNIFITVLFSVLIYFTTLILLKTFEDDDLMLLKRIIKQ